MQDDKRNKDGSHDITKFQRAFTRTSGALAIMVAAIPVAIGWTDTIPALSDTHQKFSQVNVSVTSFSSIGLIYYYRDTFSAVFQGQGGGGFFSKVVRHMPPICFLLSIVSTYFYFRAYEFSEPNEFWPLLAYSGMFVFPAVLLATITLKDLATNR